MSQRILQMDYRIPENGSITPQLRDLLSRMLVEQPGRRITVAGIQAHEWYLTGLPEGALAMNDELPEPGDDAQASPPAAHMHAWGAEGLAP